MAASSLMDDKLVEALKTGDSNNFNSLLDAEGSIDIPQDLVVPPIRSVLLSGVTSEEDRVLHIAARHGHLNLVCDILRKAGIPEAKLEEFLQVSADEARVEQSASSEGIMKKLWNWGWAMFPCRTEGTTGETAVAAPVVAQSVSFEDIMKLPCHWGWGRYIRRRTESTTEQAAVNPLLVVGTGVLQHPETEAAAVAVETVAQPEPEPEPEPEAETAAAQGSMQFVEFLRATNARGETCLHEAIRWGHISIVRLLIAVDEQLHDERTIPLVGKISKDGTSPLYLATTLRRNDIVKYLTKDYKHRVSPDGPAGKTALHAAVLLSKELCELLLNWDENLAKRKDNSEMTPLHYLGTSDTAITELILGKDDSSGYFKDNDGCLPIHIAAKRGRRDIIKMLLEKCARCDATCNKDGQTFLHVAVLHGHAGVVKYVCTNPTLANLLNMRDKDGDTALHLAVRNGLEKIFCYLFGNKEVYLSFINKDGHTPLDLAFLSIESDHGFKQRKQGWILNDLLIAGADFSKCRWDHFCSSGIKRPTDDNESEKLSKSAGLIAAGAALILSTSFAVPFNIANKHFPDGGNGDGVGAGIESKHIRARCYNDMVEFDAFSLIASSLAIFCCMIAGFHTSRVWTRSVALVVGGSLLYLAAMEILMVFAMGLTQVSPRKMAPVVVYFGVSALNFICLIAAILSLRLSRVIAHIRARSRRLGLGASLCSLFRCPRGVSPIPQLHILLLVALIASWIITNRYLFTPKSMKL
ncbi:hypothetical protein BS78_05G253400 [Paspalum vaginatum]|nr:hypothetical protein BS78_05G253400 [Paspalum vaginatum]